MTRAPPLRLVTSAAPARSREGDPPYRPFDEFSPAVVEDALDRLVSSGTFRRSVRHRRFLQHIVGAALAGRHDDLKEVVIGLEVFGRDIADYDPRRDPIVRVEAGRVREKLARYYADEGASDAFEIQIPIGGYLPQVTRRPPAKTPVPNLGSLAVLPFTCLSSTSDDATFCEALADQLIDMLSRVAGLRVVGRMSAFNAQARGLDPKAVGKLLGVTTVLEGSLQRAGSRYRCIAQLYHVRDRSCVWSQRFECDVGDAVDLFAFQDRIGDAVLTAVVPPTAAPTTATRTPGSSDNAQARDLFERGRYLAQQRTIEGSQKAVPLFERAVALDPGFASAYSQLGACLGHLAGIRLEPSVPAFREVERNARRALELDPADGHARALIANIAFRVERDWARAEPMFREALRLAPNTATAHDFYAHGLIFNGRYVEGMEHARIALDLDPLNVALRANFALNSAYARDFDGAVAEFLAVLDFDADHLFAHVMLGMSYLWSGRDDDASAHFEHAAARTPDHPIAHFCRILVQGFRGDVASGRRGLDELIDRLGDTRYYQFNRAMAHAYLDDREAMYHALQRSADAREILFVSLPADPTFDRYREEPEFVALLDRHGLPTLPPSPFSSRR